MQLNFTELERIAHSRVSPRYLARNAQIAIWFFKDGFAEEEIESWVDIKIPAIREVLHRCKEQGNNGIYDRKPLTKGGKLMVRTTSGKLTSNNGVGRGYSNLLRTKSIKGFQLQLPF